MIRGIKKIPILRYCLILSLFCILIVGIFYLLLQYRKAQKLQHNIDNVIAARENSSLIDSCIINLYSADNNSRLYTITGNKSYLKKFTTDINKITLIIDRIKFNHTDSVEASPEKLKQLIRQKSEKTDNYIKLRLLTDSLIRYSMSINKSLKHFNRQFTTAPVVKVERKVSIDTVRDTSNKPKKKLMGRLIAAFSHTTKDEVKPVIVKKDTVTTALLTSNLNTPAGKRDFKTYYENLNNVNNSLRKNEQQILMINNNLIESIIASLKIYKSAEQLFINNSKHEVKENMPNVFVEFKHISAVGIIFLVILMLLVFYNIYKIFKNEQEIIEYSEKAEQYAESKSRFLAGMSHEIRTPLNSVIGFSEQLGQVNLPSAQKEQIDAIRNSSEMLLELVNEILDFSKYETGKMNFDNYPFMLDQAIEEIFGNMHVHAIKKHILLENKIVIDKSICCEGDKMRLKQVIMNLIGNAIKFTAKGKVTLSAYVEEQPDEMVLLKVAVKDTGLGIDKNDLPHIFDEFSQVANAQKATRHKGTGLGLAICKKIIELQGGSIHVTSELGQGSCFSFEIPLKMCENADLGQVQFFSDEVMAELVKDKYVLFADDNKLNVLLGSTILKKWKVKYDVAYNGKEALDLFLENDYDMVLTDIQMPEMDGLELTAFIRNHPHAVKSQIPILALTANVMKEDRDIYLRAGINDLVLKPFHEKSLVEKIAVAIQNDVAMLRIVS